MTATETARRTANLHGFALAAAHNAIASHLTANLPSDTTALLATIDRINWHRTQATIAARTA